MEQVPQNAMASIAPLFAGWEETPIYSCLQGYMGNAWADSLTSPASAQIIAGDFCCFAGKPDVSLVRNIPEDFSSKEILMIPEHEGWGRLIEDLYPDRYEKILRYAIKKEPDVFDRDALEQYCSALPAGFTLRTMDEALYDRAKTEGWSKDFCAQFPTYAAFQSHGLGVMALYGDTPVSGAASYTVYDRGIEIEVDTQRDFRRKGLALACAAKLILLCLERGLYPSWDAHDLRSVALAEKLGYHMDKAYVTYVVSTK